MEYSEIVCCSDLLHHPLAHPWDSGVCVGFPQLCVKATFGKIRTNSIRRPSAFPHSLRSTVTYKTVHTLFAKEDHLELAPPDTGLAHCN